jgi:hypothetical protein
MPPVRTSAALIVIALLSGCDPESSSFVAEAQVLEAKSDFDPKLKEDEALVAKEATRVALPYLQNLDAITDQEMRNSQYATLYLVAAKRVFEELLEESDLADDYDKLLKMARAGDVNSKESFDDFEQQMSAYIDSAACDERTLRITQGVDKWVKAVKVDNPETQAQLFFWNRYLWVRIKNTGWMCRRQRERRARETGNPNRAWIWDLFRATQTPPRDGGHHARRRACPGSDRKNSEASGR